MGTYLARRVLLMIPTLVGITFLVFMLVALAPGGIGAALQVAGGESLQAAAGVAVQQAYLEDRYGLNDPVVVQYLRWLERISPVKFGRRDQVLPRGEVVRPPRRPPVPPLWSWYVDALPGMPAAQSPVLPDDMGERVRLWRRMEREYAEARFELLRVTTFLQGALTEYARGIGMAYAVRADGRPRIEVLQWHTPQREAPAFRRVQELGQAAVDQYARTLEAHARLEAMFNARPFPQAGVAIVPGLISVAMPDFGTAFSRQRPSWDLIREHLPTTLLLNALAIPVIYLVAIPSGILAAVRRGSWLDLGLGTVYIALYSFPVVLAGTLAIGFLASDQFVRLFPVAGLSAPEAATFSFLPQWSADGTFHRGWLLDRLWHVTLPVLCLVYTGFAVLCKQTRAAMLENLNADYVRTARAKGVSNRDVIFRHVFRNSLLPLITIFVTIFPAMLAGSVVVERIFSVRGMGWLVIEAIGLRDRELLLANTVIVACVNLLALLLADILYALADPRVTYD